MDATLGDEAIIRRCAWRAQRGIGPGLTRDDLAQEARLAIWLARRAGRVPSDDPIHESRYIAQRAYGAMLDASRQAWRAWPPTVDELVEPERHEAADDAHRPEAWAQASEAIAVLSRVGSTRVNECIDLVARGATCAEAADAMGVTQSRISQLLREARRILAACF